MDDDDDDDDVIQVGASKYSVWIQHLVHEALEGGWDANQAKWKCDELVNGLILI